MIKLATTKKLDSPNGDLLLTPNLQVETGEIITIYGESGAGKTSLLRLIAGLRTPGSVK